MENDTIYPVVEGVGGEQREEDEDDEDEDDDEQEAEEIARRLKEQLWADISKAQAAQASTTAQNEQTAYSPESPPGAQLTSAPRNNFSKKKDAALETMRSILAIAAMDALAYSTLATAVVPGTNNDNVLNVLNQIVCTGSISKQLAKSLSPMLVSLARSDTLFATMRHSNAPALQLDKGKRKRDESDEEQRQNETRTFKRPNIVYHDFQRQITEAVQVVSAALGTNSPTDGPLDPSIISSIQLQLHQLFLFAVTSSAGGGPEMNPLQEIGGLIQVLGVLSGIQIGPTAPPNATGPPQGLGSTLHPSHPWIPPGTNPNSSVAFNDIGTAVYPCLMPGCRKTFARLYGLRAHQRVHSMHRPFRCAACPASFSRNHDLKRHAKLHEKKAWQCAGCDKMFSRRDAIKRHKNSSAARGGKGEICINAAIKEVELDKEGDEDTAREGRRTKMWADIVTNSAGAVTPYPGYADDGSMEEGEVHGDVIRRMQAAVLSLHATLQRHVSRALGTDHAAPPLHLDPTGGQATLASVIARAQMQNLAPQLPLQIPPMDGAGTSGNPEGSFSHLDSDLPTDISLDPVLLAESSGRPDSTAAAPQLSLYGLSEEQTKLLEQAIANAASAAQAQAEAEAAIEEDEDYFDDDDEHDLDEINDALGSAIMAQAALGQ
ncbi:hypothetical protein PAXINDRAFT_103450 [Paxillus involutus ATCC 200175]|uniref:C2H2-type domain-containing protein n=1 Tax=Paxillus involutus ATCC 200175 TaxID=664439 RepID=A0A0C9TG48_PAXIN|nr:hypothetical protein PAXINDRAFT_103450 [Paxillus involutus ATCC 200175]